jgi:hypothetical protein
MDMSKLPRMSNTPAPPPPEQQDDSPAPAPKKPNVPDYSQPEGARPISGLVWFNACVALLLIFMGRAFPSYAYSKMTGQPFHTGVTWQAGERVGTEVDYFDLQGHTAIADVGIFFFGVVILLEAAVLIFLARGNAARALLRFTFVLTVLVTAWNFFVMVRLFQFGVLPALTLLAVAYGGYIAFEQKQFLKEM